MFSSVILVTNTITCLFDLLQMCVPCTAVHLCCNLDVFKIDNKVYSSVLKSGN